MKANLSKKFLFTFVLATVLLGGSALISPQKTDAATKKTVRYTYKYRKPVKKVVRKKVVRRAVVRKPVVKRTTAKVVTPKAVAIQPMPAASCSTGTFEADFTCLINTYRTANGKNALSTDTALNAVAVKYATYMAQHNSPLSHTADGRQFTERCAELNTTCRGENIAWNYNHSAQSLFEAWRQSPTHNANMLGNYTAMGFGISGKYAVNEFR